MMMEDVGGGHEPSLESFKIGTTLKGKEMKTTLASADTYRCPSVRPMRRGQRSSAWWLSSKCCREKLVGGCQRLAKKTVAG